MAKTNSYNQHQAEIEILNSLEKELISAISKVENENLQDKFLEWQKQRYKCNLSFHELIKEITNSKKPS